MDKREMLQGMIDEYRRKIETYQTMVAEWERELGGSVAISPARDNAGNTTKNPPAGGEVLDLVREFQFYGKSQPEAAKMLLEVVGHPVKTGVILAGIEKGGLTVGGKGETEKKQNLYTILRRSKDFGRIARDTWGLVGWPGVKRKAEAAKGEAEEDEESEETSNAA